VTAAGVVAMMLASGIAMGGAATVVTRDGAHIAALTLAHLNQVPGVLVVLAVAALLFGAMPRAIAGTWALVGYALVVGTFGPMLGLPQLAHDLSPFSHPARMPLEAFALAPVVILVLIAAATGLSALLAFGRRPFDES
jgi:ABC-2 type transport system permease protein